MIHTMIKPLALESFSTGRPPAEEVTRFLMMHGFHLELELAPTRPRLQTPAMPAQYHYRDSHETDVIYLAGYDTPEKGQHFPPHASRWWVYPGSSIFACNEIVQALTAQWLIDWQPTPA